MYFVSQRRGVRIDGQSFGTRFGNVRLFPPPKAVADTGFLDRGSAPVWIGGARSDGITVCGRKLKK